MPFEMSMQAVVEEELVEAMSFYKLFGEEMSGITGDIQKNVELDHRNDEIRIQASAHMQSALDEIRRGNYGQADNHINAAMQIMTKQEILDLQDDRPRTNALIKIAQYMDKARKRIDRLKELVQKNKMIVWSPAAH